MLEVASIRGQSQPVFEYQIGVDPITKLPTTTRGGTSGIYTNPNGPLMTGMSGLGNVTNAIYPANPDLSYFQAPAATQIPPPVATPNSST